MSHLSSVNLESSSLSTLIIRLNSGNTQVDVFGHFIEWSIRKLNYLTLFLTIYTRHHGTSAKTREYKDIVATWKMIFQALDLKEWQFLKLYAKEGSWLKYFSHLNLLYVRVTRMITNHASIGKYRLRFFPWENFSCLCGNYPIESRHYILYEYKRYNKYWNLKRDTIGQFILFLEFNYSAFAFANTITESL